MNRYDSIKLVERVNYPAHNKILLTHILARAVSIVPPHMEFANHWIETNLLYDTDQDPEETAPIIIGEIRGLMEGLYITRAIEYKDMQQFNDYLHKQLNKI